LAAAGIGSKFYQLLFPPQILVQANELKIIKIIASDLWLVCGALAAGDQLALRMTERSNNSSSVVLVD
jgi:hypothetical protein